MTTIAKVRKIKKEVKQMSYRKLLTASLCLVSAQVCLHLPAQAGETQSSSQATVNATSESSVNAGSSSQTTNSTQATGSGASQSSTSSASEAKPFAPLVSTRQQSLQSVVNEVSRPQTSRKRAVVRKRAHWKTQYWNKSTRKSK